MADLTNEGIAAFGALTDQERKTQAYNALNHAYGPAIADNPENAFNAAKASVATQTIPTQVAQEGETLKTSQLANQQTSGDQQRMAAYRAADMLASTADQNGAISPDAYDKIIRPNASLLGIDPAHVDDFGAMLSQPGGVQHLQQIKQSMLGPTPVTGAPVVANGPNGSMLLRQDKYGRTVTTELGPGVTPVSQEKVDTGNAALAERKQQDSFLRAKGWTDEQIKEFRASTTANNTVFGSGGATLPGNGGGGSPVSPQVAPGSGGKQPAATPNIDPDSMFAKLPPKGKQQALGQATQIVNQGTNLQSTNQILDNVMKQISPYTTGAGSLLKELPGTAQTDLKANLKTLEAQGLTSWIASMKNTQGQTGIGRVLQSEAKAAMTLFGNMEQDQSAKQLAFHAQLFRRTVNNLYQHAQDGFKTMYGVDAHSAIGENPAPASGGALPQGWKYLGASKQ